MHLGAIRSRTMWIYPWQTWHQAAQTEVIGNSTLAPSGSVKDVRSFLGLCGFYQRFVVDFATVAAPLTDLMQKGKDWACLPVKWHAFETLKARLLHTHVLIHTDRTKHTCCTRMRQTLVWEPHILSWTRKDYPDW